MNFGATNAFAIYWMLTCLASPISGSPQGAYRASGRTGMGLNYPENVEKSPVQFYHGDKYHGSFDSSYESIDQFQIEQQRQWLHQNERDQPQHGSYNPGNDRYYDQLRNEQESYYQTLLRVTESPLKEVKENRETFVTAQERQTYYQDYLPLDDEEEGFKVEDDFNLDEEETPAVDKPWDVLGAQKGKAKNSTEEKFAKLVTELLMKDPAHLPNLNDLNALDSLEDEMIAEASVPEEMRRRVRQVRGQQPGFLWTLARLAFEKVNDTKSAANQIGNIINDNISPELGFLPIATSTTTVSSALNDVNATLPDANVADAGSNSTSTTTTTTEAPFRLTRTELQGIIRRNVKGLIRLFRIEWQDALNQSQVSVRQFHNDLGNQIRPYLEPNPNLN